MRLKERVEEMTMLRDLRHQVPEILEEEVDPGGGSRFQGAAMKFCAAEKMSGLEKIHSLQAMHGIKVAMKRSFSSYKLVLAVVLGKSVANGNRVGVSCDGGDSLTRMLLEPTHFPRLVAAKRALGYLLVDKGGNLRPQTL